MNQQSACHRKLGYSSNEYIKIKLVICREFATLPHTPPPQPHTHTQPTEVPAGRASVRCSDSGCSQTQMVSPPPLARRTYALTT